MALARPDVWFGLAMNADPNDSAVLPSWSDWTSNLRKVTGLERGRNYELDQPMAAEPTLVIRDVNEYLNPANTTGPYAGLVLPYRQACMLAQYPATPVGGSVNLFNTGGWRGNKIDPFDPTFDSFAVGSRPNWATGVGGMLPVITNLFPFQGANALKWDTLAVSTWQGASWPVACIPGRQYTASVYVLQSAASTERISVTDQLLVADPFAGRTAVASFGSAYFGGAYTAPTAAGGAAGDYAVSNGLGLITNTSVNVVREASISLATPDHAVFARVSIPVQPSGAAALVWVTARRTTFDDCYIGQLVYNTNGTVDIKLSKRIATVLSDIVTVTGFGYARPGDIWNINLDVAGPVQRLYAWKEGTTPPTTPTLTGADTSITTGNTGSVLSLLTAGSGNAGMVTSIHDFYARGYVHGTTTATTGSYQRLSVTWTATQPQHTIQLATSGTALAGTVEIDALQHEQAAAVSAFTAAGPVISPIFRNYIEHWPREYASAGFEGYVQAPCVDAFAALNATAISGEVTQATLLTGPDYYWRLNDGTQTLLFADTSGNGRPALAPAVGKSGTGPGIEPGTAIAVPGDPGASGVTFDSNLAGTPPGNTILGVGPESGQQGRISPPIAMPPVTGVPFGVSGQIWVQLAGGNPTQRLLTFIKTVDPVTGFYYRPLQLSATATGAEMILIHQIHSVVLANNTKLVTDGQVHHIAGTVVQDAANTTLTLWVDGVSTTVTVTNASLGGAWAAPATTVLVGGTMLLSDTAGVANGIVAHATAWNRALSAAEILGLYQAGAVGFGGETTGARITRHLALGSYTGPARITNDATETVMQPPSWVGLKDLLTDSLDTMVAEQGSFWTAPDGAVVLESRNDRWLRLTSTLTIGENTAGGEVPYLMDGVVFDLDSLYVYADVQVARNNGATALGGALVDIAAARRRFFARSVQANGDFATDALAQSMANYVFYTHNFPILRVDAIEVDPASNPTLWPTALGLEIGKRVTVKRRAKAANSGAGITMSADYFVEKIGTPEINFDTGVWTYRIQLSPINAGGTPSLQPWIVGDATYGIVGQTTIPAW